MGDRVDGAVLGHKKAGRMKDHVRLYRVIRFTLHCQGCARRLRGGTCRFYLDGEIAPAAVKRKCPACGAIWVINLGQVEGA